MAPPAITLAMEQASAATAPGLNETLRENITALAERERAERANAPLSQRLARRITDFTGSMASVGFHAVLFGAWIAANLGLLPGVAPFDPTFVGLAVIASVEAIFLSTFVLISQNRMVEAAQRHAELDLHISLLAEHELTRLAGLVDRIAQRLDVPVDKAEFEEIERDVAPVDVMRALDEQQGGESAE